MQNRAHVSLALGIAVGFAFLAGCVNGATDAEVASASAQGELKEFDVYVHTDVHWSPIEGKNVGFFGFSFSPEPGTATIPGPEIRVTEGDTVRVRLHSPGPHTIHWHGLTLPWAMDGVPWMTQAVGFQENVYTYEFPATETGTYWYHCHVDAPTHVDFGLFGALIIEPRDPEADPPFDREATLILHEIDSRGALDGTVASNRPVETSQLPSNPADYAPWAQRQARDTIDFAMFFAPEATMLANPGIWATPRDYYPDFSVRYHPYYDLFMINGKSFPETEPVHTKTGDVVRIRLIHAGQLVHTMHLHGHHALVTHKDGYKLASPYSVDTLVIGPGERYDLYVTSNNPGVWDFHDHGGAWELGAYAANDHAFPGGMSTMFVYDDFEYAQLPEPEPGTEWTSGDYVVWAPSFKGLVKPPGWGAAFGSRAGLAPYAPSIDRAPAGDAGAVDVTGHAHGAVPVVDALVGATAKE